MNCPKCGAPITLDAGVRFGKCKFCESQVFFDKSGVGFYYAIPFQLQENDAVATFRRWAAGPARAKDLDRLAQVAQVKNHYFPVYYFKRDVDGREQVQVEPAGSTTLPGLHSLKVPAGDLRIFDQHYDPGTAELIKPDIEMGAYLKSLPGKPKEQALVYFPIWSIRYAFEGRSYDVIVDASSAEVFAADFPPRKAASYMAVAGLGFLAFVGEGLLTTYSPIVGIALMAATVVGVFAAALWVAKRR